MAGKVLKTAQDNYTIKLYSHRSSHSVSLQNLKRRHGFLRRRQSPAVNTLEGESPVVEHAKAAK